MMKRAAPPGPTSKSARKPAYSPLKRASRTLNEVETFTIKVVGVEPDEEESVDDEPSEGADETDGTEESDDSEGSGDE